MLLQLPPFPHYAANNSHRDLGIPTNGQKPALSATPLIHSPPRMAPAAVWQLLKPLLLISKWTGTFPIDVKVDHLGKICVSVNKLVFAISIIYHVVTLSRDFHYMYVLMDGFIKAGRSVKPIQILQLLNDTLYNFFMIAIFLLTLSKVHAFKFMLAKFEAIEKDFQLKSLARLRKVILLAVVFQMKDVADALITNIMKFYRNELRLIRAIHSSFSMMAVTNHGMIELEFGIIIYIVLSFLREINSAVALSAKNVKSSNWDSLRRIYAHLHDICVNLNGSYALCILCSLILRAILVQTEVFRNATYFYDLLVGKKATFDTEFLYALSWLALELFRLIVIIVVCAKVTNEVRLN